MLGPRSRQCKPLPAASSCFSAFVQTSATRVLASGNPYDSQPVLGEVVGGFRILNALGEGGMGSVYLAEAEGPAAGVERGRRVALKVLHPHLLKNPEAVERFEQEAEAGRRVEHENVVRTLGAGMAGTNGTTVRFLVMEYVEGRTLRQLLTELGTVPEALLREIAVQTAAGLAAIHAQGIVHRDLKPENAIITDSELLIACLTSR